MVQAGVLAACAGIRQRETGVEQVQIESMRLGGELIWGVRGKEK